MHALEIIKIYLGTSSVMFVHNQQEEACETVCRIFINKRVISMNSRDNVSSLSSSGSRPGRERGSMRKDAKSSSLSNSPSHAAIVKLSTGSDQELDFASLRML